MVAVAFKDEIDRRGVLEEGDVGLVVAGGEQRALDLGAGDVAGVDDAAAGVSTDVRFDKPPGWSWSNMQWSNKGWRFVADSNVTTLRFESLSKPDSMEGPAVDAVSVIDVTGAT